jgi:hypothetical protein
MERSILVERKVRAQEAPLVFRRKLVALVEDEVEQRGMRLEQEIGSDRCFDLVWGLVREAGLRMLADIGIRPAVKPAPLGPGSENRKQIVAEPVALLHDSPELAGL